MRVIYYDFHVENPCRCSDELDYRVIEDMGFMSDEEYEIMEAFYVLFPLADTHVTFHREQHRVAIADFFDSKIEIANGTMPKSIPNTGIQSAIFSFMDMAQNNI